MLDKNIQAIDKCIYLYTINNELNKANMTILITPQIEKEILKDIDTAIRRIEAQMAKPAYERKYELIASQSQYIIDMRAKIRKGEL